MTNLIFLLRLTASLPFRIYKLFLSPFLHYLFPGSGCKFKPSCSQVFITGIMEHGLKKGMTRGFVQLSQCHSFLK